MGGSLAGRIMAIIPARGGSKGVPQKNIRPLAGYPLIAYSIAAAKLSRRVDGVVVSTDSPEIDAIGRHYGAETPFLRPAAFARDDSQDLEFVLHALDWFQKHISAVPEYLVHLRPTTPLRDPVLIDAAIDRILGRADATSLRSGHEAPETPFKWFFLNQDGCFEGINPRDPLPEYYNLPRQAFPPVYIPNGYVDIIKSAAVLASGSLHGSRMLGFATPPVTEIDTAGDLQFLEYEIEKRGHQLWDYLRSRFPC